MYSKFQCDPIVTDFNGNERLFIITLILRIKFNNKMENPTS